MSSAESSRISGSTHLEDELELVLVADAQHAFDPEGMDLLDHLRETVSLRLDVDDHGVGVGGVPERPVPDERERSRGPDTARRRSQDDAFRPLLFGTSGARPRRRTSTSIEMPSPSEIAWLKLRGPVTDGGCYFVPAATVRSSAAEVHAGRPGAPGDGKARTGSAMATRAAT